jgi:hypothetical protein
VDRKNEKNDVSNRGKSGGKQQRAKPKLSDFRLEDRKEADERVDELDNENEKQTGKKMTSLNFFSQLN